MRLRWPGFNETGTVLIELAADSFCLAENEIEVLGETFTPKEELHVTLIGNEIGLIVQDKIKQDQTVNKSLKQIFEAIDWSFKPTGAVHILSRAEDELIEKSIIMLIEMPGVTTFYDQLKSLGLIDAEIPVQLPHVTLYTQNCPLGIGVPSNEALNLLSTKTLSLKALNELCNS